MPATPLKVRHYGADDSVFLGDDYLIKGVAGAILWKLLGITRAKGRIEFTNRELRLDPASELPENQRQPGERGSSSCSAGSPSARRCWRIEKTGRGRFRFCVGRPLQLVEMAADARR